MSEMIPLAISQSSLYPCRPSSVPGYRFLFSWPGLPPQPGRDHGEGTAGGSVPSRLLRYLVGLAPLATIARASASRALRRSLARALRSRSVATSRIACSCVIVAISASVSRLAGRLAPPASLPLIASRVPRTPRADCMPAPAAYSRSWAPWSGHQTSGQPARLRLAPDQGSLPDSQSQLIVCPAPDSTTGGSHATRSPHPQPMVAAICPTQPVVYSTSRRVPMGGLE